MPNDLLLDALVVFFFVWKMVDKSAINLLYILGWFGIQHLAFSIWHLAFSV